jgi:hypothetical protein
MPQLVKGGKWVYGWIIVGTDGTLPAPPEAFTAYAFQPEETVLSIKGSKTSGGFGVARPMMMASTPLWVRIFEQGMINEKGLIVLPKMVTLQPGERLLAVRGCNLVLSFLQHGPILEEALQHPDLSVFPPL